MESRKLALADMQKYVPWVNFVLLLVLLPLVATNSCSKPETVAVGESPSSAVVGDDVQEALKNAEELLKTGDFSGAFDMLLVASRIAPSHPNVIDLVVRFVDLAASSESEDALAMAEDLLDRGDSLVYFQRPKSVQAVRQRLTALQEKFLANEPAFEPPGPLDGVKQLLSVAGNANNPTSIRIRATEQARSLLDDVQLQIVMGELRETEQLNQVALAEVYIKIDRIEQECIENLFADMNPRINEWQSSAAQLIQQVDAASNEAAPDIGQAIIDKAGKGFDLLQELMPYSKSGIDSAVKASLEVTATIEELHRNRNWLHNKQTLALIREIEAEKGRTAKQKIGYLAKIDEEHLSPYVLRRHNELWEMVFEELPNEDEKVSAVRLRILRSSK